MAKIVFTFDQAGNIKVDAQDFTGTRCEEATKVFEQLYASGKRSSTRKPEYDEPEGSERAANMEHLRF